MGYTDTFTAQKININYHVLMRILEIRIKFMKC